MKKLVLKIDGMKCGMCEAHVKDAIRSVCNPKHLKASHIKNEASMVIDDSENIDNIIARIEKDGYRVLDKELSDYEKKGFFFK